MTMSGEEVVCIFPAKACVFPRVTPRMIMELYEMRSWPRAEQIKWTRRLLYPRDWTSISDVEKHRDMGGMFHTVRPWGRTAPRAFLSLLRTWVIATGFLWPCLRPCGWSTTAASRGISRWTATAVMLATSRSDRPVILRHFGVEPTTNCNSNETCILSVKFSGEWHTENQGKSNHWNIRKFCNR